MMMTSATLIPSQQQQQQQQLQEQEQEHNLHHDDPHSKKRTRVTPTQLAILEDTFSVSATPDSKMRKHLAQKLQMPERSIQIWFQNRRAKVKMLQRRALLREEQDMARAKLYAEAAAAAANGATGGTPSHTGSTNANISTPSPSTTNSPSSYWYGPSSILSYPHHQTTKIPIQRSWSSDPAPSPLGRHPYQQQQHHHHHHQQLQHLPQHHSTQNFYPHQQNLHQPHQPSNLSSSSMYGNTATSNPSSSFDGALIGEAKESFYHGDISPSPTPHPMGDLGKIMYRVKERNLGWQY
jgi:hypothetical protein